jgi:hypothetical protein
MEKLQKARRIAWAVLLASVVATFLVQGRWASLLWIPFLGSIAALVAIRTRRRDLQVAPARKERGILFVTIAALAWAGVDALIFGQGVIGVLVCAVGLLYLLPRALVAYGEPALFRLRLAKAGVTIAAGALAVASIAYALSVADDRAAIVISAVESFKAKQGRYPDRLDELAPAFLPVVPSAKPYGMLGEFRYLSSPPPEGRHTLVYVVVPPFLRKLYHFEEQRWSALD